MTRALPSPPPSLPPRPTAPVLLQLPMVISEITVSRGLYPEEDNDVSWSLACDGLLDPIEGGAPYSATHAVPPGPCTLTMYDSFHDGWGAEIEWTAPGWTAEGFSLAKGLSTGTDSFWAGPVPPPPPSLPPSPSPPPPSPSHHRRARNRYCHRRHHRRCRHHRRPRPTIANVAARDAPAVATPAGVATDIAA